MEIEIYFEPVNIDFINNTNENEPQRLGDKIIKYQKKNYFPDLSDVNIAIVGVKEDRNALLNIGCADAPDIIRSFFYDLFPGNYNNKIADLGNIIPGHTVEDTYFAVSTVIAELIKNKIVPIILGGSQDISFANYRAYEQLGQIINIATIDASFDVGYENNEITSKSFLSKIILHQPSYLFNYTNIGYQTYLVDQHAIDLMTNLLFDTYRLGSVREKIEEVEPYIRNADMVSFDISAVRTSDAPGNAYALPNGFYGEEACQIARYAGISDKLTSVGFYEYNPRLDIRKQTAALISQIIWYFIDGYYNRKNDFPHIQKEKDDYIKYRVSVKDNKQEIVFFKSKKSDRWWMEVPCPTDINTNYQRHYLVPCSYNDYLFALKNEMPDRWWQVYQKLM